MKKCNFSVLISVYAKEQAEYFDKALYSIIDQTLMPSEIVLVEDGKLTKELYNVIDKYKKKYNKLFKIIKLEKNMGLGNALNIGLKECSYEYVARMDSDDYSNRNRFEKEMNIIIKNNLDIVGSNIDEYDNKMEEMLSKRCLPETHQEILIFAKKRNPLNHMTVIFKKSKVIEAGSYVDCPLFEDYYLWVRMIMNGCIFYNIQESLVKVRGGLDMLNRRGGKKYIKSIVNFNKKIYKLRFINVLEYFRNIFIRTIISIIPNKIRKNFYQKHLRKEV